MKKLLFVVLISPVFLFSLPSCKKAVDKKAEDYIIKIMTDGRWMMYEFKEDGTDVTYEFNGYEFQFYKDGKVDAFLNTSVNSGTWKGDISTLSIESSFPTAGLPLSKLNYSWRITDSYINAVYAETTSTAGVKYNMLLLKK